MRDFVEYGKHVSHMVDGEQRADQLALAAMMRS